MNKIISETPDKWVILKMPNGTGYKVFATWAGGYLDGDRWKLNSGIKSVESEGDYYLFEGFSGSWYKCHKKGYGIMTSYGQGVLNSIIDKAKLSGVTIEVIDEDSLNSVLRDLKLNDLV